MPDDILDQTRGALDLIQSSNAQANEEAPKIEATYDQGQGKRVKIDASMEQYKQVVDAAQKYQQIMQGFAAENFSRAQAIKKNPWANIAATIGGSMAQYDKQMPGWVRGLGQASRQLNPTPQELIAQGSQYEQAGLGAAERAVNATGFMKQQELDIKREQMVDKRVDGASKEARLTAQKAGGPLSQQAFTGLMQKWQVPPERWESAYQTHLEQAKIAIAGEEKKAEVKKDLQKNASDLALSRGEKLEGLRASDRLKYFREAFVMTHGQAALDFEKAKKTIDSEISLGLSQAKAEGLISAPDFAQLKGGIGTNIYLSSMGTMLKIPEMGKVAEPLFSVERDRNGTLKDIRINPEAALPKAWQSLSKAEADNMIKHEIPRLLALLFKQGVGAQMFRSKEGAKILTDLGISNKIRVDQMQAILGTIRETNNLSNFAPVVMTKPNVDWRTPNHAAMVGMDDAENAPFWQGLDKWGGKIPVRVPPKPGAAAPESNDPLGIR